MKYPLDAKSGTATAQRGAGYRNRIAKIDRKLRHSLWSGSKELLMARRNDP